MPSPATSATWVLPVVVCVLTSLGSAKVIDLTHTLKSSTYAHGGMPHYNRTALFYGEAVPGMFVDHGGMVFAEHAGTHIDAPSHFMKDGLTLEDLSVEDCLADGVMVDCSEEASKDKEYLVPVQKLLDWEKEHGRIPDRAAVVFHFDWSKKFLQPQEYAGSKDIGNLFSFRHPAVSEAAGMWLADERNIKMIATDTLTPDPLGLTKRQITTLPIHVRYSKEKRLIVENLKDTGKLPPRGFRLFAVPYKFDGASGAPTRTFAITHDELGTGGASVLSASLFGVFLSVWTLYLLIH